MMLKDDYVLKKDIYEPIDSYSYKGNKYIKHLFELTIDEVMKITKSGNQ